ncbi:amino acid ABC transporter permease [Amantichitinum ursilacus]|uniref:Glutamate/aspartate transport system permease protein GltK n=1 Tax=Amantichitinum ursilacus TaxID=857265 RepID=A0A0N1JTR9_9NEIS|nr:amino acid ABC transporter permease [Amantichitinum ursilacus]KPC55004.1 Glutamate/aspartate transport system permease protein GltK [Amantichitinum ursilacus]
MDALSSWDVIKNNLPWLLWGAWPDGPLGGLALTVVLAAGSALGSAVLGLALGILLAVLRGVPRHALLGTLAFLRAIPVLMLIFWVYFLLPICLHIDVPGVWSVMCALTLISAAYLAHAVYAGIEGISKGQWEAALATGLTHWQTLRLVILPQALRMMAPSFINQWVTLIKDTSLAYIVGVGELAMVTAQVSNRVMIYPAQLFLFAGVLYFALCQGVTWAGNRVAKTAWQS